MKRKNIPNPHDRFVQKIFSRPEEAKAFFKSYLPEAILDIIQLETLEKLSSYYVDESLSEFRSDILFSVDTIMRNGAYIYLLFEHQSTVDSLMPFRVLQYEVNIWHDWLTKQKADGSNPTTLPAIFPLILYHGKTKWDVSLEFVNLMNLSQTEKAALIP